LKKSLDVLILFILVIARVRIDTLADRAFFQHFENVRRLVEGWWPAWSLDLLAHPETDPVSMMFIVTTFGLLALYLIFDIFSQERHARNTHRLKLIIIYAIIVLLVVGKTVFIINLRHITGPVSYSHDGGVIQTEITIDYFFQGLNPYLENYVDTPMDEWGYEGYRTALYHYPYLPWTFVFSAPFHLLSYALIGWFDERMVYLLLFILTLILTQKLVQKPLEKRIAVAVMGLNPILVVSLVFGENDPFVLAWIVLALWLVQPGTAQSSIRRMLLGSAAFGLACASKPTAWFLAPFWLLYLLRDQWGDRLIPPVTTWRVHLLTLLRRAWTLPAVALLIIGPWFVWSPAAMYDDVWRWAAGQGDTGYQIWGWGASNYVLGLGWVADRFAYWPFIIPEMIVSIPLLIFLLWRQVQTNTMGMMLYGYVVLLLAFSYVSRFFQPNYVGFMLGILALAVLINDDQGIRKGTKLTEPERV
jgi:hypothetical protein